MKAAVFQEPNCMTIEEIPTLNPGPGEVLVKVKYCGICGTDLHNYLFGIVAPGRILGHEWCGVITELGEGVQNMARGERVMPYKHRGSPSPPLRLNPRAIYSSPTRRMGAFAEYIVVPSSRLIQIPDALSDTQAATLEPLVAAIHAVRLGQIKVSDTVAFLGAGPIALLMIQRVQQAGARAIYVSEPAQARARKAAELGADRVLNPFNEDVVAKIIALTGGKGLDIVYECAAAKNTLNQACQLVARNGRVTCLAVYQEPIIINPLDWYMMQPEIKFTTNGDSTPIDWEIALELMVKDQIDIDTTISTIIPLNKIQETFQTLLDPSKNEMLRVLVAP
ncbi:MAG: zinc-binding dehydrogenase [Candidatus Bathyarchaeota archaeon]|nr:zinc-binding dehydrogenase [Candidatus Bathyarchaeota archaeon]